MPAGNALDYDRLCDLAIDWCQAWCRGDLDAVMAHYADDVVVCVPEAAGASARSDGWLRGKVAVAAWVSDAMKTPGLRFEFVEVLTGAGHVTILFRREGGALAAHTTEIDGQGRARRVIGCTRPARK